MGMIEICHRPRYFLMPNKALHLTAIMLRFIVASEPGH
jgi:hypothetical protein